MFESKSPVPLRTWTLPGSFVAICCDLVAEKGIPSSHGHVNKLILYIYMCVYIYWWGKWWLTIIHRPILGFICFSPPDQRKRGSTNDRALASWHRCLLLGSYGHGKIHWWNPKLLCFEWSPPWHSIHPIWHSVWQIFWHSIWHSIWDSIWHISWHSICYIFWHSIWHIYLAFHLACLLTFYLACLLTFYLAYLLTFYLAYLLTFYLAFYLEYLLTFYLAYLSGIPSGMSSDILSVISSDILSGISSDILSGILAGWGPARPTALRLAGWGPARPALRLSPVEVRRVPLRSRAGRGGPARKEEGRRRKEEPRHQHKI